MQNKTQPIPENPDVVKGYTTPIFDCYYCEFEREEEPYEVEGELCCSICEPHHTLLCNYCGKRCGSIDAHELDLNDENIEPGFFCSDCYCSFIQRGKI